MIRAIATLCVLLVANQLAANPPITALAFSPDAAYVVAASQSGMDVYDWPSLKVARSVDSRLVNIQDVVFSPDGKKLLVAGGSPAEWGGMEVRTWPECEMQLEKIAHDDVVYAADWSDDGAEIAVVSGDHLVATWASPDFAVPLARQGHSRRVLAVQYMRGTDLLVSGSMDQTLRVWSRGDVQLQRALSNHTAGVYDLADRPGERALPMIASASADRTVRFWQPTIGRMVRFVKFADTEPLSLAWTPDGAALVAACTDGQLRIVDPETARIRKIAPAIEGWAYDVAVSPENVAAVGGWKGQLVRVPLD